MTDISPAAQAVLDAAYREMDYAPRRHVQWVTAAALRAAADQVVPVPDLDDPGPVLIDAERNRARLRLLDIAAELEGFG
jgi:hypothetical protein